MLKNKKSIESYLMIVFIATFIVTILFFFILGGIYKEDSKNCKFVDFKLTNVCKSTGSISFTAKNTGTKLLKLSINDNLLTKYKIVSGKSKLITFNYKKDNIVVIPYLKEFGKNSFCKGKSVQYDIKTITKRC